METLIETIRTALASNATGDARVAGVHACREIIATLEPKLAPMPILPAQLVPMLAKMDLNQLLDVAIVRLRELNAQNGIEIDPVKPLAFPMIALPGGAP